MTFVGRLVLVVAAAVLAILIVVAAGAYLAGQRVTAEIERARVSHLLGNLRSTTEANLSIGLALDQVSSLQTRIEREKAGDPSILAIDIFNLSGRSIYSTDRGAVGEAVPDTWSKPAGADEIWSLTSRGETVFGTRFDNDLGPAGGISISVSDSARAGRNERLLTDLIGRTAAAAVAGVIVAALLAWAFAAAMTRPFRNVASILRGEDAAVVPGRGMEHLASQTRRAWTRSEERIDAGTRQLEALDDGT